ncbi:MAG TPA: PQQ-binding-like beta-propeller repeat protein [Verrucomicrobiae bacterium]
MENRPIRWWPAGMIGGMALGALLVVWLWPDASQQERTMRTGGTLLITGALLAIWWIAFSRTRWRMRMGVAAMAMIGVATLAATFRIRGVDGDLVPILEPRWRAKPQIRSEISRVDVSADSAETKSGRFETDFPQFYGPNRNAVLDEPKLETSWSEHPPKLLWRQSIGSGWGGFAVKDGFAVTQEQRGEEEVVACYELLTGRTVWVHTDAARYATTIAGEGPRATPTIATIVDDRVYTFGGTGILNCLDRRSGKLIWRKDTAKENDAKVPDWGYASSPLVIEGKVVVSVGGSKGSLAAYDANDGKFLWAEGHGGADYSSPVEATLCGERQILIFNGSGVNGHALDGKVLWNHPWRGGHPHVTAPLVISSNQILISSGYGTGAELVKVEVDAEKKWAAEREWKSMGLKSKFGPIFVKDGYIYGFDDGIFTCVELKTGERKWKEGRYGHGQGLLVAGIILLTSEKGEVVLIKPDPEKLVEIERFAVFSDKTWNPPALVGEYLLMRNDKEAACLQLRIQDARNVSLSVAK